MSRANHKMDVRAIMLGALAQHGMRTFGVALSIVLSIALEVLPPLVLGRAVDELTQRRTVSVALAAGYFVLLAGSGLASAFREAMIVATGEGITHVLRTAMMAKLRRLPASYFTDHEAGSISSLHVNDVDAIEEMFSSGLVSLITDLGTVVSILAVVFTKSLGLGLLLLLVLPALAAYTIHVQRRMLVAHTENRRATAEVSGILPETMHNIRTLHVYQAEPFAEARYDRAVQKSFRALERTNFYDAVYSPVVITTSAVVIGIMMGLSGQSGVFRDLFGMSVGTAVALISYVNSVFTPLASIGMEIQTVQAAAAGWKRVQAYLDEEERPEVTPREPALASGGNAIEVHDVSFSYGEGHPVLQHLDLTVGQGEFVTLAGRTGVGKSTLFKLLLGLYKPDGGSVRVAGVRPQELAEEARRKTICCVEQRLTALPGSIRDQVTMGNTSYGDDAVWRALDTVGLRDAVVVLPERLDTRYRDELFSQGQKQLIMIARAIVSDPQILLLDEVTAGLDSATERVVTEALRKASASRTVLSISHRLSEVIAGRIVSLT